LLIDHQSFSHTQGQAFWADALHTLPVGAQALAYPYPPCLPTGLNQGHRFAVCLHNTKQLHAP
jgi:hypothetical protein